MNENGVVVCVPNWLGDGVMALPAVGAFRKRHPTRTITILAKPSAGALWDMTGLADAFVVLEPGSRGTFRAARALRHAGSDEAYVLPNSMRSALIPFLGGVARRRGTAGHHRRALLSDIVEYPDDVRSGHQWKEAMHIMRCPVEMEPQAPLLTPSQELLADCREEWERRGLTDQAPVGLIPGAARGAAKRWPAEHFIELGRRLAGRHALVLFGTSSEAQDIDRMAKAIGGNAVSVAGQTSLENFAGMLALCRAIVANDSGGMHLAAAVGTPVVAIFGMTDSKKTGPLGTGHVVLRASEEGARDIWPDAPEAIACLRALGPDRVHDAVVQVLGS